MASKIKVKRILELREKRVSQNAIASTLRVSKHSIQDVCRVAEELGVTYSDVTGNTEDELYQLFFPDKMGAQNIYKLPDYEYVHKELAKVGVTLKLLHEEYKTECKENGALAIGYSKFCKDYGKFIGTKDFANHIIHKPGDRIEVDWSGPTMTFYDKKTGRPVTVYLFVADLVYSRLAYVEPTLDMRQMSWMSCNINMWVPHIGRAQAGHAEGWAVATACLLTFVIGTFTVCDLATVLVQAVVVAFSDASCPLDHEMVPHFT